MKIRQSILLTALLAATLPCWSRLTAADPSPLDQRP
ncbi:MAG: hypothetical protein ACI8P0_006409, partial [Planctomycetaceae bacterium]